MRSLGGFRAVESLSEARHVPVPGRLFLAYEDAALLRLAWAEGLCRKPDVHACVTAAFREYVKRSGLGHGPCHSYMGVRRDCVFYGPLRYDGHIMYYVAPDGEVVVPRFVSAVTVPADSGDYLALAGRLDPQFFSMALYTSRHTIVVRPSDTSVTYYAVSTNVAQALSAALEIHEDVVRAVVEDMRVSARLGGERLLAAFRGGRARV